LIVELDKDLKIKMFNKGCEEITGYSRSEVIGKD
jgi:PAS domain S-box-containing protein